MRTQNAFMCLHNSFQLRYWSSFCALWFFIANHKTENCTKCSACTKTRHRAQLNSVTLIETIIRSSLQNSIINRQIVHTLFKVHTEYTVNIANRLWRSIKHCCCMLFMLARHLRRKSLVSFIISHHNIVSSLMFWVQ